MSVRAWGRPGLPRSARLCSPAGPAPQTADGWHQRQLVIACVVGGLPIIGDFLSPYGLDVAEDLLVTTREPEQADHPILSGADEASGIASSTARGRAKAKDGCRNFQRYWKYPAECTGDNNHLPENAMGESRITVAKLELLLFEFLLSWTEWPETWLGKIPAAPAVHFPAHAPPSPHAPPRPAEQDAEQRPATKIAVRASGGECAHPKQQENDVRPQSDSEEVRAKP
ncbi:hypothetical protein FB451DRAFT_1179516 [Mycena latifolia]|nr:hypothetical protein FB451DRAFT_1179516 [Mycena latifolia]